MSWFANKTAFVFVLPFLVGLLCAFYIDIPLFPVFLLALVFFVLFFLFRSRPHVAHVFLLALIILIGFLHLKLRTTQTDSKNITHFADLPFVVTIEGDIIKPIEKSANVFSTVIDVDSIWVFDRAWPATGFCVLKIYEPCHHIEYGHRVVARGQLRLPSGERNPGDFNYKKYLAAQNIDAVFRVASASNVVWLSNGHGSFVLANIIYAVRNYIIRVIDLSLSGQPAALLKALLVGLRGDIDSEIVETFANVGIIHVLAVSGLHVGFILAGLLGLLSFCRVPNPWRTLLVMVLLIFYAYLTGLKPSVVRAVIMAIVFLGGLLLQRRAHLLNTLSISALIILIVSPLDLFEPGFQLSFAAVLGIIFIYRRLTKMCSFLMKRLRDKGQLFFVRLLHLFFVTVAAQIATIPLTVYYFNRFSLISFLANLIVIPAIACVVALGMVAVFFSTIHFGLGAIYLNVVWLLLQGLLVFANAIENIPFAYFILPRPSMWLIVFYILGVWLFVSFSNVKWRKTLLFSILMLLNLYLWLPRAGKHLKITFFDVGQGDAALFEFPNGKTMLVDAGDRTDYIDYGERVIYPYLIRNGIRKIDNLIVTHPHSDHNGGVLFLLEKKCVGRLMKTPAHPAVPLDSLIEETAIKQGVPIHYVQTGDTLLIDPNVLLLIFHPTPSFVQQAERNPEELNNISIVLKCVYFNHNILMTGDAEHAAEQHMMPYDSLLRSDVLKCGHHGSITSSAPSFRQVVAADIGVVSVAQFNRFGLPSELLLQNFQNEGAKIYRTSNGAIQFKLYPDKLIHVK